MIVQGMLAAVEGIGRYRTLLAVCVPLIGGALASSSSILVRRGKAQGLMTGAYLLLGGIGAGCLALSVVAAVRGLAFSAIATALLLGIVLTGVPGLLATEVVRGYQQFEVRKLAAEIFRRT